MASSDNFDETMEFVAPAGGATAGTLIVEATTLKVTLPLISATSGNNYTGKCFGRIDGVTKSSATAFLAGAALTIKTDGVAYARTAAGIVNAWAFGAAVSTDTSMSVILTLPIDAA